MIEVSYTVATPPDQVFAVLADGWSYSSWVVGTAHIRQVDPGWPEVGSRIHHSVGPWPFVVQDHTTVLAVTPDSLLELEARVWPVGAARVRISLHGRDDGQTDVRMAEEIMHGPGRRVPSRLQMLLLRPRNAESLSRLADLAEGRQGL
jgi:uncharacterized protein YndB with AHSA1/START domain